MVKNKTIKQLQQEIGEWAQATFPHQNPNSKIKHLKDEVDELQQEPNDAEEMADVAILLFNLSEMFNYDLEEEIEKKMAKNRLRIWGEPDEHGVCHHIEQ